jgi:pantoate kinase
VTRVSCPGHITGFFEICRSEDLRETGSRGAGICISKGVETKLSIDESDETEIHVKINGKEDAAPVTRSVVNYFLDLLKKPYIFDIEHRVDVPISAGFGASAAGALSTAIALNEALDLKLTRNAAATIAHIAEVENSTGLGDVIAQIHGGVEIRLEPGAPGIGKIDHIVPDPFLQLVCMSLGPLETKAILTDPAHQERINAAGQILVHELIQDASIENFLLLSRKFMEESGLLSERLKDLLIYIEDIVNFPASMVMLGESLFTFVKEGESEEIKDRIQQYSPKLDVFICDINYIGPRLIEVQ